MKRPAIGVVAALLCFVLPSSAARRDAWVEVRSPHFVVVSNAGEQAARRTAVDFEQIRALFRNALPVAAIEPAPTITILALKDTDSLQYLLADFWKSGHARPAGIFSHRMNQFYIAVDLSAPGANPYATIYHEYFHSLTTPYFPNLPTWLAEGLAEFYGNTLIGDTQAEMGISDPDLVAQLRHSQPIPLETLLAVDHASPYYNEREKTSMFYAESWALTHYLMVGDNGAHHQMLLDYLSAINRGASSIDAARKTLGQLSDLEEKLVQYGNRYQFTSLHAPAPPRIADRDLTAQPISEAEAAMYRGGFLAIHGQTSAAIALLETAAKAAPNSALARTNLAVAYFLAGNRTEALDSASRAISLDPANAVTRYIRAYLSFRGSMLQANPLIEADLRAAVAADPNFAPPHALLAAYLAAQGRDLPTAYDSAQKAVSFEPRNSMYELVLAKVLGRMERYDESHAAALRARACASDPADQRSADAYLSFLARQTNSPANAAQLTLAPQP
jgi:tetratricopeptide (TPR) repeat protein